MAHPHPTFPVDLSELVPPGTFGMYPTPPPGAPTPASVELTIFDFEGRKLRTVRLAWPPVTKVTINGHTVYKGLQLMSDPISKPSSTAPLTWREKLNGAWLRLWLLLRGEYARLDPQTGDWEDPGTIVKVAAVVLVAALALLLMMGFLGTLTKIVAIAALVVGAGAGLVMLVKAFRT